VRPASSTQRGRRRGPRRPAPGVAAYRRNADRRLQAALVAAPAAIARTGKPRVPDVPGDTARPRAPGQQVLAVGHLTSAARNSTAASRETHNSGEGCSR
jgi:hypothetical protein